jgi:hypothetical protein
MPFCRLEGETGKWIKIQENMNFVHNSLPRQLHSIGYSEKILLSWCERSLSRSACYKDSLDFD